MADILQPWQAPLAALAGWINGHQQAAIDYPREEHRVLHEHLGKRRLPLTDDQRCRLAVAGKALGRKALKDVACLFSPDTILAWDRKLVAAKWDHHRRRPGPGWPGAMKEIERIIVVPSVCADDSIRDESLRSGDIRPAISKVPTRRSVRTSVRHRESNVPGYPVATLFDWTNSWTIRLPMARYTSIRTTAPARRAAH